MMSQDQIKVVVQVYSHLMENEKRGWDGLDEYLSHLEYLDDDQIHREADVIHSYHKNNVMRCNQEHPKEECLIPIMIESVGAIIDLFKETGNLHEKNRYILEYYLAMNQAQMILVESEG